MGSASEKEAREEAETTSNRTFPLFNYLHDDLKVAVLSFVADAPFETMPENYPKSSLTHKLPHVSRKFHRFSQSDCYWKEAIMRQTKKESYLWEPALRRIAGQADLQQATTAGKSPASTASNLGHTAVKRLVEQAFDAQDQISSYKDLFRTVVSNHLRFKGPIFYMQGQVALGQPYGLHFFEPRYRLLIAQVMRDFPEEARHGGPIPAGGEGATFIHANRGPLAPTTPATLVRVLRCQIFRDGRADVLLLPTAHVWLERIWVQPHSGHLYYAQALRMGRNVSHSMNQLARQEALAHVMDQLASDLSNAGDDEDLDASDDLSSIEGGGGEQEGGDDTTSSHEAVELVGGQDA